jgi:putative tryptophan/tyrosine transport system substrate-binding protein
MRRREFIGLVGGAAAWPLGAGAQQDGRVRRVGVLLSFSETDSEGQERIQSFRQGLAALGWTEGRNLRLEVRWAGPDVARLQSQARELVALAPDVIQANASPATLALRDTTRTIPIVFANVFDPVATGIVSNLARPEGNITGFMNWENSLAGKWLSLLKDMAPRLARVALLFNPDTAPYAPLFVQAAQEAGDRLAIKVVATGVRDVTAMTQDISAMGNAKDVGLVLLPDVFNVSHGTTAIALAATHRVPVIYYDRGFALNGGLMSYGPDQRLQFRNGATYVDRILRGTKVSELPVQFATKFEFVINLKTAKALGLDVRPDLLTLADEVIE